MPNTKVINVRLPIDEAERMTQLAKLHGISRSAIIQSLVRRATIEMRPTVIVGENQN